MGLVMRLTRIRAEKSFLRFYFFFKRQNHIAAACTELHSFTKAFLHYFMKLHSSACYSSEAGTGRKTKSMLSGQHAATENLKAEGFSRLTFVDEWGRLSRHQFRWAVRVC